MISITKNFSRISAALGFCFLTSLLGAPNQASARTLPTCEADSSDPSILKDMECLATPESYKLKVFEMGLCVNDPLEGTTEKSGGYANTDNATYFSSCTATFKSENGFEVDFMQGTTNLIGQNIRPAANTYNYAYIKIENYVGIKGKYTLDDTEYCTKDVASSSNATTGSPNCTSQYFVQDMFDFRGGGICSENYESATYSSFDTGIIKALIMDKNDNGNATCNASKNQRLLGTFKPNSPIIIKPETQGLEVTFSVIDKGMLVNGNSTAPKIFSFSSGSLTPSFSAY